MMSQEGSQRKVIRNFKVIFLIIGAVLAGSITLIYNLETGNYLEKTMCSQRLNINLHQELIVKEFKTIFADLKFLSSQNELRQMHQDIGSNNYKELIDREYLEFSKQKGFYDQVRYLDETGMEISRVNFNKGDPEIVSKEKRLLVYMALRWKTRIA